MGLVAAVLAPLAIRKLFEDDESACFANFDVVRGRPPTRDPAELR